MVVLQGSAGTSFKHMNKCICGLTCILCENITFHFMRKTHHHTYWVWSWPYPVYTKGLLHRLRNQYIRDRLSPLSTWETLGYLTQLPQLPRLQTEESPNIYVLGSF